jgi:hypothetical protein
MNVRGILPFVFLGAAIGAGAASAAGDVPALKVERWVNSAPLTPDMLRGKVVLVDIWGANPGGQTGPISHHRRNLRRRGTPRAGHGAAGG